MKFKIEYYEFSLNFKNFIHIFTSLLLGKTAVGCEFFNRLISSNKSAFSPAIFSRACRSALKSD